PGYVSKCGQRQSLVPIRRGPFAYRFHESPPQAAPPMIGMNVDFLEMRNLGLEHLDVRKTDGEITPEGNPEAAFALRILQVLLAGGLAQNGVGRVAGEESGSGELDGRQQAEILRPCL